MIFVTGDTHREFRRLGAKAWVEGRRLTKSDYLIVCGDFGLLWEATKSDEELYWTNWLNEKSWTTIFIDGNHESFPRLAALDQIEMFGSKVGKISDSIYHLRRGEVYLIPDQIGSLTVMRKCFTFGGAVSIDKHLRKPYQTWWPEEVASYAEMEKGLANLAKHNNEVDVVITHTIPLGLFPFLGMGELRFDIKDVAEEYLGEVRKMLKFKKWYFGHWHINRFLVYKDRLFHGLYEDIVQLDVTQ